MHLHVVALPHTMTTAQFYSCAYTQKVIKFCRMMMRLEYEVTLYAGAYNEAPCDEHVPCVSEAVRSAAVGDKHYVEASFDAQLPHWRAFNATAAAEIAIRSTNPKNELLCLIGGVAQKPIADMLPQLTAVEFGIGYAGSFARNRVWESAAWMHTCIGAQSGNNAHAIDGRAFDAVIPNAIDMADFPFSDTKDDYFLYIGRLVDRKGYDTAIEVCRRLGKRLILAGPGDKPEWGEWVGEVAPKERGELMSKAKAVFVPTRYIEPFGGVAVEAMACGTPVITTDWGAFRETVIEGKTGWRCSVLSQFMIAARHAWESPNIHYAGIRDHAIQHYSLEAVAPQYHRYFERLSTLWGDGWYTV